MISIINTYMYHTIKKLCAVLRVASCQKVAWSQSRVRMTTIGSLDYAIQLSWQGSQCDLGPVQGRSKMLQSDKMENDKINHPPSD